MVCRSSEFIQASNHRSAARGRGAWARNEALEPTARGGARGAPVRGAVAPAFPKS